MPLGRPLPSCDKLPHALKSLCLVLQVEQRLKEGVE